MMEKYEIKPLCRVFDITLMILCWLTVSPLMAIPNNRYTYLNRKIQILLTIFSPFTWGIITFTFLIIGVPVLVEHIPSFAATIRSFPEFTGALVTPGSWWQTLLVVYFLPVYSFCVIVLFVSISLTGWTYREASVYICEYFEPWVCIAAALIIITTIIVKMRRMNLTGKLLSLIPLGLEIVAVICNFRVFRNRMITYSELSINQIFDTAVKMLVTLGEKTHTNYITANIIVYIMPVIAILLIGYIAWIIFTLNCSKYAVHNTIASRCDRQ